MREDISPQLELELDTKESREHYSSATPTILYYSGLLILFRSACSLCLQFTGSKSVWSETVATLNNILAVAFSEIDIWVSCG